MQKIMLQRNLKKIENTVPYSTKGIIPLVLEVMPDVKSIKLRLEETVALELVEFVLFV